MPFSSPCVRQLIFSFSLDSTQRLFTDSTHLTFLTHTTLGLPFFRNTVLKHVHEILWKARTHCVVAIFMMAWTGRIRGLRAFPLPLRLNDLQAIKTNNNTDARCGNRLFTMSRCQHCIKGSISGGGAECTALDLGRGTGGEWKRRMRRPAC